ncbi:hypothetical protein B0T24DRAFT_707814, partial [Lasiosphaeria ovina]
MKLLQTKAGMDTSLQKYPIPADVRGRLLQELWRDCQPGAAPTADSMAPYLDYYAAQCQRFSRDGGIHLCVRSHAAICDIAKQIIGDATRDEICARLLRSSPSATDSDMLRANTTVDLCASLLLMAEVGARAFDVSEPNPLGWPGRHSTLRQAVEQHFGGQQKALQPDNPRLGRQFTARNLARVGGMRIKWTRNVANHLLLSDDDQTVFVFHHVRFLRYHQRPLFPDGFVDETLRTLTLLLPQNDRTSQRWVAGQVVEHGLDGQLGRCGNLRAQDRRFERFAVWHDRLVILKQAFDEASPRGLAQWWADRRNSVQWYTFWVAILVFAATLFFGLVQSIEGAIQVY